MKNPGCKIRMEILEESIKRLGSVAVADMPSTPINNQIAIMNDMVRILDTLKRLEEKLNENYHRR